MTEPTATTASVRSQLLAEAVRVLTAAARRTRVIGAGTPNEHREPADFAEFVTVAATGATANIGDAAPH
jgi:hypothetical protein